MGTRAHPAGSGGSQDTAQELSHVGSVTVSPCQHLDRPSHLDLHPCPVLCELCHRGFVHMLLQPDQVLPTSAFASQLTGQPPGELFSKPLLPVEDSSPHPCFDSRLCCCHPSTQSQETTTIAVASLFVGWFGLVLALPGYPLFFEDKGMAIPYLILSSPIV